MDEDDEATMAVFRRIPAEHPELFEGRGARGLLKEGTGVVSS